MESMESTEAAKAAGKGKRMLEILLEYRICLASLLLTDLLCAVFLWLADIRAFQVLAGLFFSETAAVCIGTVWLLYRREVRRETLYDDFLCQNDPLHAERAAAAVHGRQRRQVRKTAELLADRSAQFADERVKRRDYEEYIESWAHEVKTPLTLITLMLDSRSEEMSETVRARLSGSQIQIQGYVEQILCYSRLKAEHKDYVMESLSPAECCREVLAEYQFLLQAYGFRIRESYTDDSVFTDRKALRFLLGQVIINAAKYRKTDGTDPELHVRIRRAEDGRSTILSVADNGIGVMKQDLPFIFDKGFCSETGESGRTSTGMGLYLVRQMAEDLGIGVTAESEYGHGFAIHFCFCDVRDNEK